MKGWVRLAAAVCAAALCAGCALPGAERASVEELLRAPRLEGDYGEIQAALDSWLGQSAQLRYPLNGDLLSPFLMSDFDGDGVQDAAVLYTAADVPNICLAVLQKDGEGAWQVQDAVEGLTDTVDAVQFARLQEGGANQILVGYTAQQADSYLAVYAYQDGAIEDILAEPYDQYLIEDITGTGYEDLLVMDTDAEGASQIKLLTSDREGGFRQAAVMGLSADRFTGCASLAAGMGAYGGQYLVLDGWTGVSGTNLASVLLRYNEKTQQMEPARQIGADALYEASLRNVPDLTSRDLDRDGATETVLRLVLDSGAHHGWEVLRQGEDGTVYGYILTPGEMLELKSDGSYCYSYSTSSGFGRMFFADTDASGRPQHSRGTAPNGSVDTVTDADGSVHTDWYLDYQAVTQEEYEAVLAIQQRKEDALWYPFSKDDLEPFLNH